MGETSEKRPRAKAGDEDGRGGEVRKKGRQGENGRANMGGGRES